MFRWTDEAREFLKTQREAGVSSSHIAKELGCTRNAVIGMAHRMGLERMRPNVKDKNYVPKPRKPKVLTFRVPGMRRDPFKPKEIVMPIEPLHVPLLELRDHHCRNVEGKGEDGLATYCGHPVVKGRSYCEFHHALFETRYELPKNARHFRIGRAA